MRSGRHGGPFVKPGPAGTADIRAGGPWIVTRRGLRPRPIPAHDLSKFERPVIRGNRGFALRALWYLVNCLCFQSPLFGLVPSTFKATLLRLFGARVGKGFVCKPRVTIKYPWFLEIGDYVWIGELAWIDNHTSVRIESNVCISQGAYIFTGNHDWSNPSFRFFCREIRIGTGSWIGAFAIVPPGADIPPGTVIGAGVLADSFAGGDRGRDSEDPPWGG